MCVFSRVMKTEWEKTNERRLARSCRGNREQTLVSPAGANRDNDKC